MDVVNKLREKVAGSGFHFKDKRVPVTVSCGIAEFRGEDTPEQVFNRADAALYRAKEQGRNCCMQEE
jgi:diguanylate cyclase